MGNPLPGCCTTLLLCGRVGKAGNTDLNDFFVQICTYIEFFLSLLLTLKFILIDSAQFVLMAAIEVSFRPRSKKHLSHLPKETRSARNSKVVQ